MIFISWVLVIIAAIVVIQLPALPFRNMLKKSYQEILKAWDRFLKIWNSFPSPARFIIAIISFMVLACGIMFLYKFHGLFDIIFLSKTVKTENLSLEALSNIRRNIWLLGFAIFGGCLAIWARFAHEKQLKYTHKQLEISERKDNNDRFIKAIEMLENVGNITSSREGLLTLRNLADEAPKTQYIRCVNIVCDWLLENKDASAYLLNTAIEIFKIKNIDKLGVVKDTNDYRPMFWPNLRGVNLQNTDLRDIELQGANLQDANLKGIYMADANLQGANLMNANLDDVDLGDANLQNANLDDANLQKAYLEHANLQGAKLHRANLEGGYLFGANLRDSKLVYIKLGGAGLMEADLQNANLWNADLEGANLQNANLERANLKNANLLNANLQNTNLEGANLINADMRNIEDLTKEQILSAKWKFANCSGKPPQLPDELMKDPDVQGWLKNPSEI